ncbi:MAG TPA: TRZ/ATZ family hydrolase [Rhodocyclaceae bacterium]
MTNAMTPAWEGPSAIDLLINARWIIPVEPRNTVLEHHALAVNQGRIVALLPQTEAQSRFQPRQRVDLAEHVLIPGLVNLHTHAAMSLLRGYADDLPLMRWLQEKIWPAEAKHVAADFVRDGTLLAAAEMLRGGVTTFSDMYFYPEASAESAIEAGIRAVLGLVTLEFPTNYAADAASYLDRGLEARDKLRDEALIGFTLAPHAPYTVSDRTFERIATLSAQLNLPIHTHLHETAGEVADSLKAHGVRPLERLRRLGLLGPELIAAHAVHLTPGEIETLATHGCRIAHCPTSNMKLASGAAPIAALLQAGACVGLGTDGSASNNRLDLLQEMRHAALLGKLTANDAAALDAHAVLGMATLGGATALGMDDRIGSLLPGKLADLCAVRLDDWIDQPRFDPASHLVYVLGREKVSHVWVGGRLRLADGRLNDIDISRLQATSSLWQNRLV